MEIKKPKPLKTFLFKNGLTNKIRNIIKLHVEWFYTFKCKNVEKNPWKHIPFLEQTAFATKFFGISRQPAYINQKYKRKLL